MQYKLSLNVGTRNHILVNTYSTNQSFDKVIVGNYILSKYQYLSYQKRSTVPG